MPEVMRTEERQPSQIPMTTPMKGNFNLVELPIIIVVGVGACDLKNQPGNPWTFLNMTLMAILVHICGPQVMMSTMK